VGPSSSLSPTTVGVVAPGPDSFRGPRTLSGTPRPGAQVHHTTGAAASPVRASTRASEEGEREEGHDEGEERAMRRRRRRKQREESPQRTDRAPCACPSFCRAVLLPFAPPIAPPRSRLHLFRVHTRKATHDPSPEDRPPQEGNARSVTGGSSTQPREKGRENPRTIGIPSSCFPPCVLDGFISGEGCSVVYGEGDR